MGTKVDTGYHAQDGQEVHPILSNTAKDGTGTWYFPLLNSDGQLVLALAAGTNVMGKVRLVNADGTEVTNSDGVKTSAQFGGVVYRNRIVQGNNNASRFENSPLKVRDAIIKVTGYAQVFGDQAAQTFPVDADGNWSVGELDVSTLYFKNATAGSNGTVHIIAVRV